MATSRKRQWLNNQFFQWLMEKSRMVMKFDSHGTLTINHGNHILIVIHLYYSSKYIQLFGERLSEKVHAMKLKGIVGSTEFTVLQRNLKECFIMSAKGKQQKYFRQLQCQEQCIDRIPYYPSGFLRAQFFRQPFLK